MDSPEDDGQRGVWKGDKKWRGLMCTGVAAPNTDTLEGKFSSAWLNQLHSDFPYFLQAYVGIVL
jgi:hypothetical protein